MFHELLLLINIAIIDVIAVTIILGIIARIIRIVTRIVKAI